jgi:hypothetical protein
MTDWSKLTDVGGSAEYLPELLEELATSHDPEIIDMLWERLYHQGSVYSASFAALPQLIRIAEQWYPSDECLQIIWLAISILTGEDGDNMRHPHDPAEGEAPVWMTTANRIDIDSPNRNHYQTEIDALLCLTKSYLQEPNLSWADFLYVLCSSASLKGYSEWSTAIEYFALSQYGWGGSCNSCGEFTYIYNNDEIIVAEIEKDNTAALQTSIDPVSPESLTGIAKWLYETAWERRHSIAKNITHILGKGKCPECGAEFKVPEIMNFTI